MPSNVWAPRQVAGYGLAILGWHIWDHLSVKSTHWKWIYWTSGCMQLKVHVGDPNLSQSMELHQNHRNQLNSLRIMWMDSPAKKKTTLPKQDPGLCLRISCSSAAHHGTLWAAAKNEPGFASRVLIDFLFFSSSYFCWGILLLPLVLTWFSAANVCLTLNTRLNLIKNSLSPEITQWSFWEFTFI